MWMATKEQEHPPLHPFVHILVGWDHRNSTHHRNMCCSLCKSQQNKETLTKATHFSVTQHWNRANKPTEYTEDMKRSPMGRDNGSTLGFLHFANVVIPSNLLWPTLNSPEVPTARKGYHTVTTTTIV